jgi:hypothetical protein
MWCYRDLDHIIGMIGLVVARDGENVQRQREVRRRRRRRQRPAAAAKAAAKAAAVALDGSLDAAPGTIAGAGSREGGGGIRLVYRYRACESPAGHSSGQAVPRAEGVTFASGSGGMRMEKGRAQPLRANLYPFATVHSRGHAE